MHGILLCHARVPEAARLLVEAARYPFAPKVAGLDQGLRGSGSQGFAAQIWGISQNDYLRKADPWPLNKEGEILLGVKIEDSYALANAEKTTKVPGIAFAEWGPGDMGFWLLGLPQRADRDRCAADARGARACAQGDEGREDLLPELLQRQERRRDDQGRRDDLYRRLRGRAEVYEPVK